MDAFVAMQHPGHALCCPSWILRLNTMGGMKTARGNAQDGVQSQPTSISGKQLADNRTQQKLNGVLRGHRGQHTFHSIASKDCMTLYLSGGQTEAAEGMEGQPSGQERRLKETARGLKSRIAWMDVTRSSWRVKEAIKR